MNSEGEWSPATPDEPIQNSAQTEAEQNSFAAPAQKKVATPKLAPLVIDKNAVPKIEAKLPKKVPIEMKKKLLDAK